MTTTYVRLFKDPAKVISLEQLEYCVDIEIKHWIETKITNDQCNDFKRIIAIHNNEERAEKLYRFWERFLSGANSSHDFPYTMELFLYLMSKKHPPGEKNSRHSLLDFSRNLYKILHTLLNDAMKQYIEYRDKEHFETVHYIYADEFLKENCNAYEQEEQNIKMSYSNILSACKKTIGWFKGHMPNVDQCIMGGDDWERIVGYIYNICNNRGNEYEPIKIYLAGKGYKDKKQISYAIKLLFDELCANKYNKDKYRKEFKSMLVSVFDIYSWNDPPKSDKNFYKKLVEFINSKYE